MAKPFLAIGRCLSTASRRDKRRLFTAEMCPSSESSVLDVGMDPSEHFEGTNILEKEWPWPSRVLAVSLDFPGAARLRYPLVQMVQADACYLPFADSSVDYVWSNAVVEHVGSRDRQVRFVSEALRVAKRGVFVTTPNRWFPLESHTHIPFIHWLPKQVADRVFRRLGFPWMDGVHLLSEGEFRGLFPSATNTRIIKRRWVGLAFSFVALVSNP